MGRIRHPRHERRAPRHLSTDGAGMSNFLQRVAATIIQPKARLQPMFGSIFAPATLPSPAEFSPAQAEISSQTFAPHRQEPMTAPHFDASSQAFASQAFASEDRLFSATAIQSASPSPYQPLIAASQQPAPKLQPREPMPTSTAARTSASEAARRAQSAQREADEIHIHIGRIEVAAIIQPPPRPTAAAARRSLNLDEYLRRGTGRPG